MAQERNWTQEEDKALRYLFEEQKIQKWSLLAQRLSQLYKIRGLTGKKCKRRYLTLVPEHEAGGLHTSIDLIEEAQINRLHDQIGNKWSVISRMMNEQSQKEIERTDNIIKNFFYSKLRKALRKVNKIVEQIFGSSKKPIRECAIYKIVEITDERFKNVSNVPKQLVDMSIRMKTWLYQFLDSEENNSQSDVKQFYEQVNYFLQNMKKGEKRPKKNSHDSEDSEKLDKKVEVPKLQKISRKKNLLFWDDLEEEHSIEISVQDDSGEIKVGEIQNRKTMGPIQIDDEFVSESSDDVEEMLEEAGVLQLQFDSGIVMEEEEEEECSKNNFLNQSFENYRLPLLRQSRSLNESFLLFTSS